YYTSALIYSELFEYDMALEYYQKHLNLRDSIELESRLRQEKLLLQQIDLERREKEVALFLANEDVQKFAIAQLKVEKENQELALKNKEAELLTEQKRKEILEKEKELLNKNNEILNKEKELLNKGNEILQKDNEIKAVQAERARKDLELARQSLKVAEQEKAYAELEQQEKLKVLELQQKENQLLAEKNEKELLLKKNEVNDLELQKQAERIQFFAGLGFLLGLIVFIIFLKNRAIEKQKEEISIEREKADGLLLNILPAQVANELKETGKATTKKYKDVSILFTDFKGFTELVATIPATVLIKELNEIFSYFDDIMDEFQIEKIETIGDAYMAACGLPEENKDHALQCVKAAHKMIDFLKERNKTHKIQWEMRVGIHSGAVVAGVVGKKKFAYDLFGDTVNTASRMESNSEAGRVNVSQTTYQLIKNKPNFDFESRGEIFAKGKGDLEMWFVNELV
ncbi:MAG: adenylate/guanylate cyclase domain-containing protein, partial [Chitinophagales bacterium]